MRRIGSLGVGPDPTPDELEQVWAPARSLGWIEGKNLIVERRRTMKRELLRSYAEELVRLEVEIIVTIGTDATIAASNATKRIPIVMFSAGDPVATGLVRSLAKPGGNITGYSLIDTELTPKAVSLLREALPGIQRIGVLGPSADAYWRLTRQQVLGSLRSLGVQPILVEVADDPIGIEQAVTDAIQQGAQALLDLLGTDYNERVVRSAINRKLPVISTDLASVRAGGLLAMEPDKSEQYRIYAFFVDRILRGANPGDLPIQQPSKFVVAINMRTAKQLGLTLPRSLVERADEVIQ